MKILIVEDQPLIVEGLRSVLQGLDPNPEVLSADLASRAFTILDSGLQVDLVLLDLNLPDASGMELLERIRSAYEEVPVVVISAHDSADTITAALDRGAMGFISKSSTTAVLISALQLVLKGAVYLPPQVLRPVTGGADETFRKAAPETLRTPQDLGLTERQSDVLALLVEGKPNKVICRELNISEGTAKTHISTILRVLRVRNRTQALFALSQMGVQMPKRR